VPVGNSAGSDVSPFRPLDVPADLAALLAAVPPRSARSPIAAASDAGARFGSPPPPAGAGSGPSAQLAIMEDPRLGASR
jgi:hypothetical protein